MKKIIVIILVVLIAGISGCITQSSKARFGDYMEGELDAYITVNVYGGEQIKVRDLTPNYNYAIFTGIGFGLDMKAEKLYDFPETTYGIYLSNGIGTKISLSKYNEDGSLIGTDTFTVTRLYPDIPIGETFNLFNWYSATNTGNFNSFPTGNFSIKITASGRGQFSVGSSDLNYWDLPPNSYDILNFERTSNGLFHIKI